MSLKDSLHKHGYKPFTWKLRPELLLHPQIPKPMHGVAPRVVLGATWWEQTRKAAYRKTAFHCSACGVYKGDAKSRRWLEAHEFYEIDYLKGRMKYIETVALCHYCHNYIHYGRLLHLLETGMMSQQKFASIIKHGYRILSAAGLEPLKPYDGPSAKWETWRLRIGRHLYPPKFKTAAQWIMANQQ